MVCFAIVARLDSAQSRWNSAELLSFSKQLKDLKRFNFRQLSKIELTSKFPPVINDF